MTDYFTAHDVLKKIERPNFPSILNKWANFIQKECDYQFCYDYIRFAGHTRTKRTINHHKTRVFSLKEIQKFQKVVKLVPILGRNTPLRKLFGEKHHLDTMNHSKLLTGIINQIKVELANREKLFQALTKRYQQLERSRQTLEQRSTQLEKSLSAQEQTSSGWSRRKR